MMRMLKKDSMVYHMIIGIGEVSEVQIKFTADSRSPLPESKQTLRNPFGWVLKVGINMLTPHGLSSQHSNQQ